MNKRRFSAKTLPLLLLAAIVLIVFLSFALSREKASAQEGDAQKSEGYQYIAQMETVDTTPIEDRIFEEDNRKSTEELLREFAQDPAAVWKTLKDYDVLMMGDSRALGFLQYDYMDAQHCLVTSSTTIYTIESLLGDVAERKPRVIVISYGINDVGLHHDYGVENYMRDFAGLIDDLKEAAPGVTVYVNSILPCLESEYDRAPNWMAIPAWNAYIKAYCEEHDIGYIDVTELCNQHRDLYIEDGVHMQEEFYPYWGAQIAAQIVSDLAAKP